MTDAVTVTADDLASLEREMKLAHLRHRDLGKESGEIAAQVEQASRHVAREKAAAARSGESTANVAAETELDGLQARRDQMPMETWAAEIASVEAEIAHQEGRREYYREQHPAAAQALREAIEAERRARDVTAEARLRDSGVTSAELEARGKANRLRTKLSELERAYPGAEDNPEPVAAPRTPSHAERVQAARARAQEIEG